MARGDGVLEWLERHGTLESRVCMARLISLSPTRLQGTSSDPACLEQRIHRLIARHCSNQSRKIKKDSADRNHESSIGFRKLSA